jgi:hypothetical protein
MKIITTLLLITAFFLATCVTVGAETLETVEIPANLEEAYKTLDKILTPEDIEYIKNSDESDRIWLHFGLNMGLRNYWLRPDDSPLQETLAKLDNRLMCLDSSSRFITEGYHHYLNGSEYTVDMYFWEQEEWERENLGWWHGMSNVESGIWFIAIFALPWAVAKVIDCHGKAVDK